jgi:hypothetical protein
MTDKIKLRNNLIDSWKNRKDYLGEAKNTSMYNTHRSICYTKKGKLIGYPKNWQIYKDFVVNIPEGFKEGYLLLRINKKEPYSKENCFWGEKGIENLNKLSKLIYNNEEKTLLEWCKQYNLNYNGVRQRFFKGKNYSNEEILFGKLKYKQKEITDIKELTYQKAKDKVSKMLSAYKNRDFKKQLEFNVSKDYFLNNILLKSCIYCGDTKKIGADRINNQIGHIESNIVPCCYSCNVTRSNNYSYEEMLILGKTIKTIKNKRNENN